MPKYTIDEIVVADVKLCYTHKMNTIIWF